MRLIMLSAGQGLRMGRITHLLPKSLLPIIDGSSIASVNIDRMAASGAVTDLVVVGGHCWETVSRFSRTKQSPLPIASVFNKEFATTGAARSIAVALDYAGTSVLEAVAVANGDTLLSEAMLRAAGRVEPGFSIFASYDESPAADDMLLTVGPNSCALEAGKGRAGRGPGYVSAGLFVVRGQGHIRRFRDAIERVLLDESRSGRRLPWHSVIQVLSGAGETVAMIEVPRTDWHEFDTQECIDRYERLRTEARASGPELAISQDVTTIAPTT